MIAGLQKNNSFGAREGIVSPTFPPHRHGVKPQQQRYVVEQSSLKVNFSFEKPNRSRPNVPVIAGLQKNNSFGARGC